MKTLGIALGTAFLSLALAAPASAGTTWSTPQQIASKPGRDINVSDNGNVAVWINTDSDTGIGPVRTIRRTSGGWSSSKKLPSTSGVADVQLNGDGTLALLKVANWGYYIATRAGSTWSAPLSIISGSTADNAQMSRSGNVIVWVDSAGSQFKPVMVPCEVKSITRNADGTWTAPVVIGKLATRYYGCPDDVSLSGDGSTVAFFDETYTMRASRLANGVWSALPSVFTDNPAFDQTAYFMALSTTGDRLLWSWGTEDYLYSSLYSGLAWSPEQQVSSAGPIRPVATPKATTLVFDSESGFETVWFNGSSWVQVAVRASTFKNEVGIANTTIASSERKSATSNPLRTQIFTKKKWQKPVQVAKNGIHPGVSGDGRTLMWTSGKNQRMYVVRR